MSSAIDSARYHHSASEVAPPGVYTPLAKAPVLYTTPPQLHASVARMNLSGARLCVFSRLCVLSPPYQWTPMPSKYSRAVGSEYAASAQMCTWSLLWSKPMILTFGCSFRSTGPRWSRTNSIMNCGVHRHASHPTAASGSFCTVTPHRSIPCLRYAAMKREK